MSLMWIILFFLVKNFLFHLFLPASLFRNKYTILKGFHVPLFKGLKIFNNCKSFVFYCNFTTDSIYVFNPPTVDQLDINKLCGFSYYINPHRKSFRIGWEYDPKKPESMNLHWYRYFKGKNMNGFICSVPLNLHVLGVIKITPEGFQVKVDRTVVDIPYLQSQGESMADYITPVHKKIRINPQMSNSVFFGGNRAAPKKIKVEMKIKRNPLY